MNNAYYYSAACDESGAAWIREQIASKTRGCYAVRSVIVHARRGGLSAWVSYRRKPRGARRAA